MQSRHKRLQVSKSLLKNLIHCSSILNELWDMVNSVYQAGTEPPAFNIQLSEFSAHYQLTLKEICNHLISPEILTVKNVRNACTMK